MANCRLAASCGNLPAQGPQAGHHQGPFRFTRIHGRLSRAAVAASGPRSDIGASRTKPGTIDALIVRYLQHDAFRKALAPATQAFRGRSSIISVNARHRAADATARTSLGRCSGRTSPLCSDGKSPDAQRNWLKTLRGLIAFAIAQGECTVDPSAGIKPVRGIKSTGHMTWKPPQIVRYRERHAVGTTARLALELMLNVAARREDAHKLGRQHMSFDADHQVWKLTWRPSKTLRSTGKTLTHSDPAGPASGTSTSAQ